MIITSVNLSAGENEVFIYGADGEKYRISVADAKRVGVFKFVEAPELLPEEADGEMLDFMTKKLSCVSYAAYLLEFGDKSKKALVMKLKLKGYDSDVCEAALDVLEKSGIIDDDRLCASKLLSLARSKFYGPYRLKAELANKGFSRTQIENALDDADIDFDELLGKLVDKLTVRGFPEDEKGLSALKNKLSRYGYGYDSISTVLSEYM